MTYQIDDRIGILTLKFFGRDKLVQGTVVGLLSWTGSGNTDGVIVHLDGHDESETIEFNTAGGYQLGTFFPKLLVNQDWIEDIQAALRPDIIDRFFLFLKNCPIPFQRKK